MLNRIKNYFLRLRQDGVLTSIIIGIIGTWGFFEWSLARGTVPSLLSLITYQNVNLNSLGVVRLGLLNASSISTTIYSYVVYVVMLALLFFLASIIVVLVCMTVAFPFVLHKWSKRQKPQASN